MLEQATLVDDMGPNTFDEILKRATTSVGGPTESIIADESIRNVVKVVYYDFPI